MRLATHDYLMQMLNAYGKITPYIDKIMSQTLLILFDP